MFSRKKINYVDYSNLTIFSYMNIQNKSMINNKFTFLPRSSALGRRFLIASCITWICIETADNTASSNLLNSSKHPQAPHFTRPINIRPIDFTSIPWKETNLYEKKCFKHLKKNNDCTVKIFNCFNHNWIGTKLFLFKDKIYSFLSTTQFEWQN